MNANRIYHEGCRVKLLMNDPDYQLMIGDRGTIWEVDLYGICHIHWDSGVIVGYEANPNIICSIPILTKNIKYQIFDIDKNYSIDLLNSNLVLKISHINNFTELANYIQNDLEGYIKYINELEQRNK